MKIKSTHLCLQLQISILNLLTRIMCYLFTQQINFDVRLMINGSTFGTSRAANLAAKLYVVWSICFMSASRQLLLGPLLVAYTISTIISCTTPF